MSTNTDSEQKLALRKVLASRHHKQFWQSFATENIDNSEVVRILFEFMLEGKDRLSLTCAEIIRYMSDLNRRIVDPYIDKLIDTLNTECHDAVKRCIFKMFQYTSFNEKQTGRVVDTAFRHVENRSNAIAIRVFAMTTLYNITKTYPELYDELVACISANLSEESAGFKNRAGKIINRTWKG